MAQQLWFLRHGEAVSHGSQPDFQRELTEKGSHQARMAGVGLAKLDCGFTACYSSPKVRARDTARIACAELGLEVQEIDPLAGEFDRADALELLLGHEADDHLLLVGHEPDFSQVVHDLTGARVMFKKGGIVGISVENRAGELLTVLRPRDLAALSGLG